MSRNAATEAMRIVRAVSAVFPSGQKTAGSAFYARRGALITCAHCVLDESGQLASRVRVERPDGTSYDADVAAYDVGCDLARLSSAEVLPEPVCRAQLPELGDDVLFAGRPAGIKALSVFSGMVSQAGPNLLANLPVDLVQIAGMVNNGNSGGPLIDACSGEVLGVMTAKYVPLLHEIDVLQKKLDAIPQFPSSVGLGDIDFSAFVNLTIRSTWQLAKVLRLVQVGTGWAVPVNYFNRIGVS